MKVKLEILPPAQLSLWAQLQSIPKNFVLYGGTAIALQLGHRQSVDFDFFSSDPFDPEKLKSVLPFLNNATFVLPDINTLNCIINLEKGNVKIQFLGGISQRIKRVEPLLISQDNGIQIASLRDLFGTKLQTIQARAEVKDYLDIYALIKSGISLSDGLACAKAIYGFPYDVGTSLRALCSYQDGNLSDLSKEIQIFLCNQSKKIEKIPLIYPICDKII